MGPQRGFRERDRASTEGPGTGRRGRFGHSGRDRGLSPGKSPGGLERKVRGPSGEEQGRPSGRNGGTGRNADWTHRNRGLIMMVMAFALVLLLIIASLQLLSFNDTGNGDISIHSLQEFRGGSREVLINATFLGNDAYIRLPWNATVTMARLNISGSLPPGKVSFEAGKNPSDLAVGDVDGDLLPDVVVVNYGDSTLTVLRNVEGKTLEKTEVIEVGTSPLRVELAELNGDGYPDALVLSEDSRDLTLLMNDRRGGFRIRGEPFVLPTIPSDLGIGDLDGDGDTDAVVSTTNDDNITLFINDGQGNMDGTRKILTEGNPTRLAVADMDLDGRTDIIVSNRRDEDESLRSRDDGREVRWFNSVSIFRNLGDLHFSKMDNDLRCQKGVSSMVVGDINGDGWEDVVMANLGYHNVTYILSDGRGDYERGSMFELDVRELVTMDATQVLLADLDSDGDLDIWALTRSADSVMFYANDGRGNFLPYVQSFVGVFPTSFDLVDLDIDGDLDIVTSDWQAWDGRFNGNGTVSVLYNLRDGVFRTYRKFGTGNSPRGVFAGDIDLDGDSDIASANYFGSTVSILKNDGLGRFFGSKEYPIGLEPYAVVLEDFDGDGTVDGASADEANFRIVLLRSDGEGGFTTERFLYDIGAYPFSLRTGDIDSDGDMDLYTSNYFQNSTTLMFNDGSGNFSSMFSDTRTVYLGNNMPYDSLIADLDGDGLNDLITVNRGDSLDPSDTVSVMLNDGTYSFTDRIDYRVGREPTSAVLFDMDSDGDLDLATADTMDDTFTILENDGNGVFSFADSHPVGDRPQYINTIDMDSDGNLDLVITSSDSNALSLFRNDGTGEFSWFSDLNIASYPYAVDSSDFNSDGRMDMVITSVNTNSVIVTGCYHYPEDVSLNVGGDWSMEFTTDGMFTGERSEEVDISDAVRDFVSKNRPDDGYIDVPLRITAGLEGVVSLSDLVVVYTTP